MRMGTFLHLPGCLPNLCLVFPSIYISFLHHCCQTRWVPTQSISSTMKCVEWMYHDPWQCDTTHRNSFIPLVWKMAGNEWWTNNLRCHQWLAGEMLHLHIGFQTDYSKWGSRLVPPEYKTTMLQGPKTEPQISGIPDPGKWSLCCCLFAQSCPNLCDLMDCSPLGSFVHGISQARILEWVAISFSRGSSQPRDWTCISCIGRWILYHRASRKPTWSLPLAWGTTWYRWRSPAATGACLAISLTEACPSMDFLNF